MIVQYRTWHGYMTLSLLLTETPTHIASHHLFLPFSVVLDRVGVCGASVCIWRVDCVLLGVYRFHEVFRAVLS